MPRRIIIPGCMLLVLIPLILVAAAPSPTAAPFDSPAPPFSRSPALRSAAQQSSAPAAGLAEAEALRDRGDYDGALEHFTSMAHQGEPAIRGRAWLGIAETLLSAGDVSGASRALDEVIAVGEADEVRGRALVRLAILRRDQGDCRAAIGLFHEAEPLLALGPYLPLQRAACHSRLGEHAEAIAEAEAALRAATTRAARVDALERLAYSTEALGQWEAAARWYGQVIQEASTDSFRTEMRYRLARVELELGLEDQAVERLRGLVVDHPSLPAAGRALDALLELGREAVISYADAGLVHYYQGRYARARDALDTSLMLDHQGPQSARARYFAALILLRQGQDRAAAEVLVDLAHRDTDSQYAPIALLRGARVFESIDLLQPAAEAYQRLATWYPHAVQASEARFRLGFVRWLQDQPDLALQNWTALADNADIAAAYRAQALLWLGILASTRGESSVAEAHWRQSASLAPDEYNGLRAASLLSDAGAANVPSVPTPPELGAWSRERGGDWETLLAEVQAEDSYRLAQTLLSAGLSAEAGRELWDLANRLEQQPERLFALSALLARPGTHNHSMNFAHRATTALKLTPSQLPLPLQRLLYPFPYETLLRESAERAGVGALLLAALVRQESSFNPSARSPAGALGLTQVMPQTGRLIAVELGVEGFETDQLLRPRLNLEFGAKFLSDRLKRYQGYLQPALAGYNAGDGAVAGWLDAYGDDVDVFAERIPYAETYKYVRVIYENLRHYERLYGQ